MLHALHQGSIYNLFSRLGLNRYFLQAHTEIVYRDRSIILASDVFSRDGTSVATPLASYWFLGGCFTSVLFCNEQRVFGARAWGRVCSMTCIAGAIANFFCLFAA